MVLEVQFRGQLDVARRIVHCGDVAERRTAELGVRLIEINFVENVESLAAELKHQVFVNRDVLDERSVVVE